MKIEATGVKIEATGVKIEATGELKLLVSPDTCMYMYLNLR